MTLARRAAVNTGALVGGQALQALGGAVAIGITSRYLGTDRFGAFITATTFFSLFQLTSEFGIGPVSTRQISRYPEQRRQILSSTFVLAALLGAAGGVCAIAAAFAAYQGENQADITGAVALLSTQLVCAGPRAVALASIAADQRAYLISASWIITRVVTLGGIVAVAAADLGYTALVAAYAATSFVQTLALVAFARRDVRSLGRASRHSVRVLFDAALPLGGVNVLNYLYFRLDLLLLSFLATPRDVAMYGLAYKVIEMLMQLPSFVMVTLMPELARRSVDPQAFLRLLQRALDAMVLLAVPVLLVGVLAEQMLVVLGGPEYASAADVLRLLLFGLSLAYLQNVLGHALVAQGRQRIAFRVSLIVLLVNLALNLVLIPVAGTVGAAIAVAVSEIVSLGLMWLRFAAVGRRPVPHISLVQASAGAVMLCLFLGARFLGDALGSPDAVTLVAGGAVGTAGYVAVLAAGHALPVELLALLKRRAERPEG